MKKISDLIKTVKDNAADIELQEMALSRLGKIGWEHGDQAEAIVLILSDIAQNFEAYMKLREESLYMLGELGCKHNDLAETIVSILSDIVKDPDTDIELRETALSRLGKIGWKHEDQSNAVVSILSDIAKDPGTDIYLRESALLRLGWLGRDRSNMIKIIAPILHDIIHNVNTDTELCKTALCGLVEIGLKHSDRANIIVPILSDIAQDNDVDIGLRETAISGMGRTGGCRDDQAKTLYPILYHFLGNEENTQICMKAMVAITELLKNVPEYRESIIDKFKQLSQNHRDPTVQLYASLSVATLELKDKYSAPPVSLSNNNHDSAIINLFMDKAGLPLPKNGQYMNGVGCKIIFLTEYGLVIKVMDEKNTEAYLSARDSDLVLQPLKHVMLGESSFMILPAIELVKSSGNIDILHWDFIREEIKNSGFKTLDMQSENIGLLPVSWEIDGQMTKLPVILDHGCIRRKTDPSEKGFLKSGFNEAAAYTRIQEKLFGHIKEKLLKAWPEGELPDPDKMADFFDYCAKIVARPEGDPKRVLVPGWNETDENFTSNKSKKASVIAQKYATSMTGPT